MTNVETAAPPAVSETLAAGLAHHRAGRLAEAEAAYKRVLAIQPEQTDGCSPVVGQIENCWPNQDAVLGG